MYTPSTYHTYINPQRGWIVERSEMEQNHFAPWQKDKNWLKGRKLNEDLKIWKRQHIVQEYDRTASGHWYAKEILRTQETTKLDENGVPQSKPRSSQHVTMIFIDTEREIPDELMNPKSVTTDLFDSESAIRAEKLDKGVARIDARKEWPATPEELAKLYFQALADKRYEDMAIYHVTKTADELRKRYENSSQFNNIKFSDIMFGKYSKLPHEVTVPYNTKQHYKQFGNNSRRFLYMRNVGSKKKRFYVEN